MWPRSLRPAKRKCGKKCFHPSFAIYLHVNTSEKPPHEGVKVHEQFLFALVLCCGIRGVMKTQLLRRSSPSTQLLRRSYASFVRLLPPAARHNVLPVIYKINFPLFSLQPVSSKSNLDKNDLNDVFILFLQTQTFPIKQLFLLTQDATLLRW